jgi:hypothetical protein
LKLIVEKPPTCNLGDNGRLYEGGHGCGECPAHWRERLPRGGGRLVAIGWTGDGDEQVRKWRSVPLVQVEKILAVPDVRFVSVERPISKGDVERLSSRFDFIYVGDQVSDDMAELACVLSICDHTITVDNTLAHVAGALVPTFLRA